MSIDTVILDLGNVLAFHDNAKLFREMAKAFHSTPEAMQARLDSGLWDKVNRGQMSGDALRRELVTRLGHELSPEAWFTLWNCHFTIHAEMVTLVERLVGRVKLVLLSNTHDQHVAYLRPKLPVLERFEGLVLSYEVGAIKPEPAIYQRALEVAKTRPDQCVFFDDVETYAQAATALGLQGRVFTTAARCTDDLRALKVVS